MAPCHQGGRLHCLRRAGRRALLEAEDVPFLPDGRVDWKALRERQKNA